MNYPENTAFAEVSSLLQDWLQRCKGPQWILVKGFFNCPCYRHYPRELHDYLDEARVLAMVVIVNSNTAEIEMYAAKLILKDNQ